MPWIHFKKITLDASQREIVSTISMIQKFLDWGFDAFCLETAQKISSMPGPIGFLELWDVLFEGLNYAHGSVHYLDAFLPNAYIKRLRKSASLVLNAIEVKNVGCFMCNPIEETFLILFFFRLRFDEFFRQRTSKDL